MCATAWPVAVSVATTWPENVVPAGTFDGSRVRVTVAVPCAGTVTEDCDSVYASASVSRARASVTSASPSLR